MRFKSFFVFHIAAPVFFGLSAVGALADHIYTPAFVFAFFALAFSRFGWDKATQWLNLPSNFVQWRWWCAVSAFLISAALLASHPKVKAKKQADELARIEQKRVRQIAQDAAEAKRKAEQDPFSHLFSVWDGSCRPLVAAVKANLKDPDSFQHVSTSFYRVGPNEVRVTMKYRAKNGFGGYAVGTCSASVSPDGLVSELFFD